METGGELAGGPAGTASTGALPPPRLRQVEWKTAIRCAAAVAGVAAALSLGATRVDMLSSVSFLWTASAAWIALGFYQKRRPTAWMDGGVGARIGVVVGVSLALALGVAMASAGLVARYALHTMGGFDQEMTAQVQKAIQQSSTPIPAEMMGFVHSPEFRGGMMLAGYALVSAGLVVLSMLSGAIAGLLRMRRGPTA